MTPFLSGMTPHGVERVRRLRSAATREEFDGIVKDMGAELAATLGGGAASTQADSFVLLCAAAERMTGAPRARAAAYDGAAQSAMFARAYREALFAFEKAEEARPCPERRRTIAELRRALLPGEGKARVVKKRSANRTGGARRT